MEIRLDVNLQHNRYKWQEGKRTDDVEQTLWRPNAFVVPHEALYRYGIICIDNSTRRLRVCYVPYTVWL